MSVYNLQDGATLREDCKERFLTAVQRYYMILRIFGTLMFAMSCIACAGFLYSFLTDPNYQQGTFSIPIFRGLVFVIAMTVIGTLLFGTYQMMMIYYRKVRQVKKNEFTWCIGTITEVHRRRYKNDSAYMKINDERCVCLMSHEDFNRLQIGDEAMVLHLGAKNTISFAMNEQA